MGHEYNYDVKFNLKSLILQHAVESIWLTIKDLIEPSQPAEVRQFTLTFLRNLIFGQVCSLTNKQTNKQTVMAILPLPCAV